jgi:hypothetical protein
MKNTYINGGIGIMKEIKRFGDLSFNFNDVSEWVKFNDLLDKEILVLDYIKANGNFGEYAIIKFSDDGGNTIKATTSGGKVVMDKLQIAKERDLLPLVGKVVRKKRWFDLV